MSILKRPLPLAVATWINEAPATATEKQHLTKISAYLVGRFLSNNIPFDEPLDVSREHFRNNCGTQYLKHLRKLEQAGIVSIDHNYTPGQRSEAGQRLTLGQCKRYQFTPMFVFTDPQICSFSDKRKKQFDSDPIIRQTVNNLSRLRLSFRESEILPYLKELVTPDYIRDRCKVNEEIEQGNYTLSGADTPRSRDYLQRLAKRNGCDLILYRDKAFLAVLSNFIQQRQTTTATAYLNSLLKLKHIRNRKNIECKRNTTNYRLDTNLTNLKTDLLQFVKLDGEHLVSIDLCNSQPLLLAHLIAAAAEPKNILEKFSYLLTMCNPQITRSLLGKGIKEKVSYQQDKESNNPLNVTKLVNKVAYNSVLNSCLSNSCTNFINSTKKGVFYTVIANSWPWVQTINEKNNEFKKARSEAKKAMFVALFAAARYNPPAKKLLESLYPGIVHFTNSYKRKFAAELLGLGMHEKDARAAGKRALAVTLQQIESYLFIDVILARLLREGYKVFSKHDSILCKASDLKAVNRIVRAELDSYLGSEGYTLKTEHHTPCQ